MCIVQCFSFRKNTKFVRLKHKQDFCSCKIHENAKLFFSLNSFAFQRQYNCLTYKLYVDIYSTVTTLIWLRIYCCQDSEISCWLKNDLSLTELSEHHVFSTLFRPTEPLTPPLITVYPASMLKNSRGPWFYCWQNLPSYPYQENLRMNLL